MPNPSMVKTSGLNAQGSSLDTDYPPLPGSIAHGDVAHDRSINWGDFRQARADGDFGDDGTEVQIS